MFSTPASLLQRLRDPNDAAAWQRFIDYYTPLLLVWVQRLPLHGADGDDLIQDIFVKLIPVLRAFDYDPNKSFRGYLRTTCQRCWQDYVRRRTNHVVQAADEALGALPAKDDGQEAFWNQEYHILLSNLALDFLAAKADSKTQAIIQEVVISGRRAKDVGDELGLSENAVNTRLYRVLRKLRQALNGLLD